MKICTVREFRDGATGLLRSKDPVLVTRRGRLAGVFFPCPQTTPPLELKREVFPEVARTSGSRPPATDHKCIACFGIPPDLLRGSGSLPPRRGRRTATQLLPVTPTPFLEARQDPVSKLPHPS